MMGVHMIMSMGVMAPEKSESHVKSFDALLCHNL